MGTLMPTAWRRCVPEHQRSRAQSGLEVFGSRAALQVCHVDAVVAALRAVKGAVVPTKVCPPPVPPARPPVSAAARSCGEAPPPTRGQADWVWRATPASWTWRGHRRCRVPMNAPTLGMRCAGSTLAADPPLLAQATALCEPARHAAGGAVGGVRARPCPRARPTAVRRLRCALWRSGGLGWI